MCSKLKAVHPLNHFSRFFFLTIKFQKPGISLCCHSFQRSPKMLQMFQFCVTALLWASARRGHETQEHDELAFLETFLHYCLKSSMIWHACSESFISHTPSLYLVLPCGVIFVPCAVASFLTNLFTKVIGCLVGYDNLSCT